MSMSKIWKYVRFIPFVYRYFTPLSGAEWEKADILKSGWSAFSPIFQRFSNDIIRIFSLLPHDNPDKFSLKNS